MYREHQFIRQVNCYFNVKDKGNTLTKGSYSWKAVFFVGNELKKQGVKKMPSI
ncbi:hypothetical protein [Myroides sp. DW712]|uniref:hypothetical protein n=1 Tax=Myroides sp. DW712 TaxID=3389800 RepID=UPI00397E1069